MQVQVLFFGMLKDLTGSPGESLEAPDGARVETVFEHYASKFPKLREMADSIAMARNHEFVQLDAALSDGDEVAFMPPVSGGSQSQRMASLDDGNGFYAITEEPIDAQALAKRMLGGADGAVLTFEGVVRDNTGGRRTLYLDYECYAPMAIKTMREIGREILERHPVHAVGMIHRVGRLQIRETSIAIVVSSAHRKPAYEASLEAINRVKQLVPVWKKEYFEDGEVWVEGSWEDSVPRSANVQT